VNRPRRRPCRFRATRSDRPAPPPDPGVSRRHPGILCRQLFLWGGTRRSTTRRPDLQRQRRIASLRDPGPPWIDAAPRDQMDVGIVDVKWIETAGDASASRTVRWVPFRGETTSKVVGRRNIGSEHPGSTPEIGHKSSEQGDRSNSSSGAIDLIDQQHGAALLRLGSPAQATCGPCFFRR